MSKRQIVLTDAVVQLVETQVACGRYADFSAAIQEAARNFFVGPPSSFEEYGVTPDEVSVPRGKTSNAFATRARPERSSPGSGDVPAAFV